MNKTTFFSFNLTCLAALLSGCASTPPVSVNYYLPKGDLEMSVVRTIGCNKQQKIVKLSSVVTSKIAYSADASKPKSIAFKDLGSPLANSDVGFKLTQDGRLTGVNVTQTGQGSAIIEAAVGLASLAFGAAGGDASQNAAGCKYIQDNGKDNVLTLKYVIPKDFSWDNNLTALVPIPDDSTDAQQVATLLGDLCLHRENVSPFVVDPRFRRITVLENSRSDAHIWVTEPALVELQLRKAAFADCDNASDADFIWAGKALVPQLGESYTVPIPKAQPFGKQTIALNLSESGAINEIKYGTESGVASALGAASKVLAEVDGKTDAEKAAALDSEADVIAQQERVAKCRLDSSKCPT